MKTLLFALCATATLAVSAFGQAALRPTDVKIEKISPAVIKTPEYTVVNAPQHRSKPADWLEVEVEFQTVPEMIDELSFNYKMLINGKLLVGEITHIDIPKGREHYSVAYVAPRSLENVMGGKQMTAASIQGIWVEVQHQGQVLTSLGLTKAPVPNVAQVTGKVLNKTLTPFAPLFFDRYEAIKPAGR